MCYYCSMTSLTIYYDVQWHNVNLQVYCQTWRASICRTFVTVLYLIIINIFKVTKVKKQNKGLLLKFQINVSLFFFFKFWHQFKFYKNNFYSVLMIILLLKKGLIKVKILQEKKKKFSKKVKREEKKRTKEFFSLIKLQLGGPRLLLSKSSTKSQNHRL